MGPAGKCCCYYCAALMIFGIIVFGILIFLEAVRHKWLMYKQMPEDPNDPPVDPDEKIAALATVAAVYFVLFLLCAVSICCDNKKKRLHHLRMKQLEDEQETRSFE